MTTQQTNKLLTQFRILYIEEDIESVDITKTGVKLALTNIKNAESMGFTISKNSIETFMKFMSCHKDFNLYDYLQSIVPDPKTKPMYPNFPTQVMEMDELEFRCNQLLHYMSTYGAKQICNFFGIENTCQTGWLPDVEDTPKTKEDTTLVNATALDFICYKPELQTVLYKQMLCKKERINVYDESLLMQVLDIDLLAQHVNNFTYKDIKFHENLVTFIHLIFTSDAKSENKVKLITNIVQHPTDIFKYIYKIRKNNPNDFHFKTSQKRVLTKVLDHFLRKNEYNFIENLENNRKLAKIALQLISYTHLSPAIKSGEYEQAKQAIADLRSNKLRGWASEKERLYKNGTATYDNIVALCGHYSTKPGIFLRELRRFLDWCNNANLFISIDMKQIEDMCIDYIDATKLSFETLTNVINDDSMWKNKESAPCVKNAFYHILHKWIENNLASRLKNNPDPEIPKNKLVALDTGNFNLDQSTITFNKGCVKSYLKDGISVNIPSQAKKIRFFVFWNDTHHHVDLDLHTKTDTGVHIGWNGSYNRNGITTSGDITHSHNACEYIDIDLARAKQAGIKQVKAYLDSYTRISFKNIETAFCGVLAVDNADIDTKLYNSKNVLYRVNLNEPDTTHIRLCDIDIEHMCIRYHMNDIDMYQDKTNEPNEVRFSLKDYLNTLSRAYDIEFMDINSIKCKDALKETPIFTIDKSNKYNSISLIDKNWFL